MSDVLQTLYYVEVALLAIVALLALLKVLRARKPFKITTASQVFAAVWALLLPAVMLWFGEVRIGMVYGVVAALLGVLVGLALSTMTRFQGWGAKVDARVSVIPAVIAALAWVALAASAVFLDSGGVSVALLLLVFSAFVAAASAILDLVRSKATAKQAVQPGAVSA